MTQWETITGTASAGNKVTHIVPTKDLKEHKLDCDCWCNPTLDEEIMLAIHNSADNREAFETGKRLTN